MVARPAVVVAFTVLLAAGLTACGGSSKKSRTGVTTPSGLAQLYSGLFGTGHRYTLNQVKAAFATQGIELRTMRSLRGGRVIVLFDPRWHAPWGYHYHHVGKQPSATQFLVFVHANAGSGGYWLEDGNLWVDNGQGLGPSVDAALHKLDQISKR
jgi:hypothetical protein